MFIQAKFTDSFKLKTIVQFVVNKENYINTNHYKFLKSKTMKKTKAYLLSSLAMGFLFLSSCNRDNGAFTISSLTVEGSEMPDSTVTIKGTITDTDDEKIDKIEVYEEAGGSSGTLLETITVGASSYDLEYSYKISSTASDGDVIKLSFKVYDEAKKEDLVNTSEESVTLNITETGDPIYSYTAVLMGAQNNSSTGSFYNSADDMVYLIAQANSNQSKVDFIYYYGNSNDATLAAPDDATVDGSLGASGFDWTQSWTVKNATRFKASSGFTTSEFDAMTDDSDIAEITGINASLVTSLAVGDVVAFETASTGKKGLLKVSAISGTDAGTMTIDVKVQQ